MHGGPLARIPLAADRALDLRGKLQQQPVIGLPLGIQAIARQANDGLLLQFAAQIERAIDGKWNAGERPGVHVTNG